MSDRHKVPAAAVLKEEAGCGTYLAPDVQECKLRTVAVRKCPANCQFALVLSRHGGSCLDPCGVSATAVTLCAIYRWKPHSRLRCNRNPW